MTGGDDTASRPVDAVTDPSVAANAAVAEGEVVEAAPSAEDPRVALERERDEYLDALQRLKAEFENYRKRSDRERISQRDATSREVVLEIVPVLDNLDRACTAPGAEQSPLYEGVEMVRQQLAAVLGGRGLAEMDVVGQPFDPTQHDAVTMAPSDQPEGTIVAVVQKGYRMGDVVIRAAKVVVAAGQ